MAAWQPLAWHQTYELAAQSLIPPIGCCIEVAGCWPKPCAPLLLLLLPEGCQCLLLLLCRTGMAAFGVAAVLPSASG